MPSKLALRSFVTKLKEALGGVFGRWARPGRVVGRDLSGRQCRHGRRPGCRCRH